MGIGEDYQNMRFNDVCDVTKNVSEINVAEKNCLSAVARANKYGWHITKDLNF